MSASRWLAISDLPRACGSRDYPLPGPRQTPICSRGSTPFAQEGMSGRSRPMVHNLHGVWRVEISIPKEILHGKRRA